MMAKAAANPILHLIHRLVEDPKVRELPDRDLLQRFGAQQDQGAFHSLLRRHGPMVLDVCRGVLGDGSDAEDAFQATFLVLAQKSDSIRKRASLGSWLYGVAHRTALKARAQSAVRQKYESRAPQRETSEADDLSWREVRQVLHQELGGIPERYREALILCYLEGATQERAAARLGLAERTVRERLEHGRELLRRRLVRRGLGPAAVLAVAAWPVATLSAAVPAVLVGATVKAATRVAAGGAATPVVSATVAALTKGGLKAMLIPRLTIAAALLAAAMLATGALLGLGIVHDPSRVLAQQPRQIEKKPPIPVAAGPRGPNKLFIARAGCYALIDPDGKNGRKVGEDADFGFLLNARLSPDGKKLAALVQMPHVLGEGVVLKLYLRGLEKKDPWVDLGVKCQSFAWSADGTEIACSNFTDMNFMHGPDMKSPEATHFVVNVATKKQNALKISADHVITDWSRDGKFFLTTSVDGRAATKVARLHLMNRDGTEHKALMDGAAFGRLSPEGGRVLCTTFTVPEENKPAKLGLVLSVLDIASGKVDSVEESGDIYSYCWSPDAKRIAYTWREAHEGKFVELLNTETKCYVVVCDPDGKSRTTIATEKGRGPTPVAISVEEWR